MTIALVSLLTGVPVRDDVAMTGEITLRGQVLPVGGITPEVMASYLAAGANGFGLGSGVYVPGPSPADTLAKARAYREALGR